MEPSGSEIDAILDAYDHRLMERRRQEAETQLKADAFARRFGHFRDEVAQPIMASVGLQLARRGHGAELDQGDRVYDADGRQEVVPAIALYLTPGSLRPVPVEQRGTAPSLILMGSGREQKVIVCTDSGVDPAPGADRGGDGDPSEAPAKAGGKNEGGGKKPPRGPARKTLEIAELTPQKLTERLTRLVAEAFGRLPGPVA